MEWGSGIPNAIVLPTHAAETRGSLRNQKGDCGSAPYPDGIAQMLARRGSVIVWLSRADARQTARVYW